MFKGLRCAAHRKDDNGEAYGQALLRLEANDSGFKVLGTAQEEDWHYLDTLSEEEFQQEIIQPVYMAGAPQYLEEELPVSSLELKASIEETLEPNSSDQSSDGDSTDEEGGRN